MAKPASAKIKIWLLSLLSLLVFTAPLSLKSKTEQDNDLKVREEMVQISKELGVTCTHCHDPENFKDAKNKNFKVAFEHLKITKLLNSQQAFNGKPKITCFACHQGHAQYTFELSKSLKK